MSIEPAVGNIPEHAHCRECHSHLAGPMRPGCRVDV